MQGLGTHHTNKGESAVVPRSWEVCKAPKVFTRGTKNHCARTEATVHSMQEKITENTSLSPCQTIKATDKKGVIYVTNTNLLNLICLKKSQVENSAFTKIRIVK